MPARARPGLWQHPGALRRGTYGFFLRRFRFDRRFELPFPRGGRRQRRYGPARRQRQAVAFHQSGATLEYVEIALMLACHVLTLVADAGHVVLAPPRPL